MIRKQLGLLVNAGVGLDNNWFDLVLLYTVGHKKVPLLFLR